MGRCKGEVILKYKKAFLRLKEKSLEPFHRFKKENVSRKIFGIVMLLVGIIHCTLLLIPLIWFVIQSFNSYYNYLIDPFSFPSKPEFNNYAAVFQKLNLKIYKDGRLIEFTALNMLSYSLIIATVSAFLSVFVSLVLGYVIAKFRHVKICRWIYNVNLFTMILPVIGSLPSALLVHRAIGTYDNLTFLLVGYTGLGMNLLLFYNAFKGMPDAYREAAEIDGANMLTIMVRIYMPLALPLFFALFFMSFMTVWQDYSINVVWLPSYPSLAYGMFRFQSFATLMGASAPEIMAGFVLLSLPLLILWTCSQKLISSKMQMGGLKG